MSKLSKRTWGRQICFRMLAIGLGLLPLVVAEAALRVAAWEDPNLQTDPYIAFASGQRLFVYDSVTDRYRLPESRRPYFLPTSFPASKPANEFRIFCVGGSTVQGRPFATETAFSTWLRINLELANTEKSWRVVNCGGVSYASYRLAPIVDELLQYDPDLLVLYTGHNEFLEDRSYRHVRRLPRWLLEIASDLRRNMRTVAWAHHTARQVGQAKATPLVPSEVEARLDYRGGLELYHRDDAWHAAVEDHFEFNVRRMVAAADDAGVPLIVLNPVSNLRDCPPFKSETVSGNEHPTGTCLQDDQLCGNDAVAVTERIQHLKESLTLAPRFAATHYRIAKAYDSLGMLAEASAEYRRAKNEDVCPLRMTDRLHDRLQTVVRQTGTPMVDVESAFTRKSEVGIPGDDLLVDHVHPSIRGHQLIAELVANKIADLGLVTCSPVAATQLADRYKAHLASLDLGYFELGKARLQGLRLWTQGRSNQLRVR